MYKVRSICQQNITSRLKLQNDAVSDCFGYERSRLMFGTKTSRKLTNTI